MLNKVKETSPETFEKINGAIQNKDDKALASIFDDPQVKQQQQAISQQVTTESLAYVSEADQKPSLINSIWSWVKKNPKISAVAALAVIATLGFAVYGAGGVVALLKVAGSAALANSKSGAIGGGIMSGAKSVIDQGKTGNISAKQVAKDALKGAAIGAGTSAIGGALGAIGSAAASGIGALGSQIAQSRQNAAAEQQAGIKISQLTKMSGEEVLNQAKQRAIDMADDSQKDAVESLWQSVDKFIKIGKQANPDFLEKYKDMMISAIMKNNEGALEELRTGLKDMGLGEKQLKTTADSAAGFNAAVSQMQSTVNQLNKRKF